MVYGLSRETNRHTCIDQTFVAEANFRIPCYLAAYTDTKRGCLESPWLNSCLICKARPYIEVFKCSDTISYRAIQPHAITRPAGIQVGSSDLSNNIHKAAPCADILITKADTQGEIFGKIIAVSKRGRTRLSIKRNTIDQAVDTIIAITYGELTFAPLRETAGSNAGHR